MSTFTYGSGGGGGGDSIVTPPAATSEAVAAGGSAADKTFGAFTDPDGVISTYSHEVEAAVGSVTATDGGTNDSLGPWAFSGETDGDSFALLLHAKDASGNILATAVHQVDVAEATSGSWTTIAALTLTGADSSGPHTSGTQNLQHSASTTVQVTVTQVSGNSGDVTFGTGGAVIRGGSAAGAINATFLLDAECSPALAAGQWHTGPFAIQAVLTNISLDGASSGWLAVLSDTTGATDAGDRGIRINNASGNQQKRTRKGTSDSDWEASEAQETEGVLTLIVHAGKIVRVKWDGGTTTVPTPDVENAAYIEESALTNGSGQAFTTTLNLSISAVQTGDVTVEEIYVKRYV